jgi:hypothetical protein
MPKAPTRLPNRIPESVARKIAERFCIPEVDYEPFCDALCNVVERLWKRDRRAVPSKPGASLHKAAEATRALRKAFDSLPKADRGWVENIHAQSLFCGSHDLDTMILDLSITFNHAVGKPAPVPRKSLKHNEAFGVRPLSVRDQMFREVVIGLLTAATENHGKPTLDANCKTGRLIEALDLLRDHLPQGLVPEPDDLPAGTIQRIRKQFLELRK